MPRPIHTLIILSLLLIPLVLKAFIAEPYPAIILPSGASRIQTTEEFTTFSRIRFFAEDQAGTRSEVSTEQLIHPIPPQYIYALLGHRFGLESGTGDPAGGKERQQQVQQWLADNVGGEAEAIIISREFVERNRRTGELSVRKRNEETVRLR